MGVRPQESELVEFRFIGDVEGLFSEYATLFEPGLVTLNVNRTNLDVPIDAVPKFSNLGFRTFRSAWEGKKGATSFTAGRHFGTCQVRRHLTKSSSEPPVN